MCWGDTEKKLQIGGFVHWYLSCYQFETYTKLFWTTMRKNGSIGDEVNETKDTT